jgi:hypothetical protein
MDLVGKGIGAPILKIKTKKIHLKVLENFK